MDYETLTTADLTSAYNARLAKNVKVGNYPRIKMIQALQAINEEIEEAPGGVGYPAPAPVTEEEAADLNARLFPLADAPAVEPKPEGSCPLCGGDPANQTAAGAEGTFLGESCQECHDCGKVYNTFTGVEVPVATAKKRRIINPQPKIDAKAAALKADDMTLFYDRNTRLWMVTSDRADELLVWHLPSREFAQYSTKEMVAMATQVLRP